MVVSNDFNELMKVMMDPNSSKEAREAASKRMQELSNDMMKAMMGMGNAMSGTDASMAGKGMPAGTSPKPAGPVPAAAINLGPDPYANGAKDTDILGIAKYYYDKYSKELGDVVGSMIFDGKSKDDKQAEEFCSAASLIAALYGGGAMVAAAAAAVGISLRYARSSGTLASMLQQADFVSEGNRLFEAKALIKYALSIDKKDINLHITLALILEDLNDVDGALTAIDAALAIDRHNKVALIIKLNLIAKIGGSMAKEQAKKTGDDIKENDGELSKRDKKQEGATKGMEGPKRKDSKEVSQRKLNELYRLELITPADMIERIFPAQAKELRERVKALTNEDKLGLTEFPAKIVNNPLATYDGTAMEFMKQYADIVNSHNEIYEAVYSRNVRKETVNGNTAIDYMREYNHQILDAAIDNYKNYSKEERHDFEKVVDEQIKMGHKKSEAAGQRYSAAVQAQGGNDPGDVLRIKFELECNAITMECRSVIIPAAHHYYTEVRKEGEKLWEKMLPFARCTANPGHRVAWLYKAIYERAAPADVIVSKITLFDLPFPGVAGTSLQSAIYAVQDAKRADERGKLEALEGWSTTLSVSIFELKMSQNSIELEAVKGIAGRVAYNHKTKEAELGIGAGVKQKVGTGVKTMGLEAKAYTNFVFDLRKNELTDIYISGEAKGSAGFYESGVEARMSFFGKGGSISAVTKENYGPVGVEHKATIISSQ